MTTRSKREFLKVQLLETRRMRELVGDHPLMSIGYEQRIKELEEKIATLPMGHKQARAILFFSGEPVQGSQGIDASFVGHVLEPFQSMVMTDYADRWQGAVGSRGRRAGEADSRLLLTALPRGSFGLELERAETDELFEEDQLADTLAHVTKLVEAAGSSDEVFASELNETAPRVIQKLKIFLEVIAKAKAGLRLETGDYRSSLTPASASEAYERVASTMTKDEEIRVLGTFNGVLLDDWKFNFVDEKGFKIRGKIDEDLTPSEVKKLALEHLDKRCIASLRKTTVLFKNGQVRTTYTLMALEKAGADTNS